MASTAPRLYDATGTEIPQIAPMPTATVRPPGVSSDALDRYRLYPSRDLRPATIVDILEAADNGDPFRLIELEEEMVEKDGKLESVLAARTAAIAGLNWDVVPTRRRTADAEDAAAADIARFCQEALDAIEFSELVTDLMDAVGKPFAVDWITWGTDADGKIVPTKFDRIPTKHLRWAFQSDELRVYQPGAAQGYGPGGDWGAPLPPYCTVRAIDLSRRDHPTRAGALRALVWPYFFKVTILKDMVSYADRFGLPPRTLKIDQADFDNAERYQKFRQAMRDFGSDLSAVISKSAEMDVNVVATRDGVEVFIGQVDYFDKWMAWKILGHELTSQSSPGQGQLGITAAMDVKQEIKEKDCRWLAGIIKRDILTPMVGWNFGWDAVANHLVPEVQFDYELPRDLNGESQVLERVMKLFPELTISKQEVRDAYGIPAPIGEDDTQGDDSLTAAGPAAPAVPFGAAPGDGAGGPAEPPAEETPSPSGPRTGPEAINSTLAAASRRAPPAQAPIDRLAGKGITAAGKVAAAWNERIRAVLSAAMADGLTLAQTRRRIVETYPELDVADLNRSIREQLTLARLWGRNG